MAGDLDVVGADEGHRLDQTPHVVEVGLLAPHHAVVVRVGPLLGEQFLEGADPLLGDGRKPILVMGDEILGHDTSSPVDPMTPGRSRPSVGVDDHGRRDG